MQTDTDYKAELRRAYARIEELESRLYRSAEMVSEMAGRLWLLEAAEVERQQAAARLEPAQWMN